MAGETIVKNGLIIREGVDPHSIIIESNGLGHGLTSNSSLGAISTDTYLGVKKTDSTNGGATIVGISKNVNYSGVSIDGYLDTGSHLTPPITLNGVRHSLNILDHIGNTALLLTVRNNSSDRVQVTGGGAISTSNQNDFENGFNVADGGLSLNQSNSLIANTPIVLYSMSGINHGLVSGSIMGAISTRTFGGVRFTSDSSGGTNLIGFSSSSIVSAVSLTGYIRTGSLTNSAILINGISHDGSDTVGTLGSNLILDVQNNGTSVTTISSDSIKMKTAGMKFYLQSNRYFDNFLIASDSLSVSDNELATASYLDEYYEPVYINNSMAGAAASVTETDFPVTSSTSARFDYYLEYFKDGTPGYRTGSILAVTDGTTVKYTHTVTTTIGTDSKNAVIVPIFTGGKLQLEMTTDQISSTRVRCFPIF